MIGFPLFSIDNRPLKVHWTTGPDPWIGPFLKIGLWDPFNKRSFDHWSILDPYENRSICLAFVGTLGLQGFPRNFNYSGHGPSSVIFFNSPLLKLCVTSFMQMWPELTYYQNAQRASAINSKWTFAFISANLCKFLVKKSSNYLHNAIVANEGTAEYIQEQDDKSFGSVSRNPG